MRKIEELNTPQLEYYRDTYKKSERWDDSVLPSIADKTIIVYCEQGFGDIIQFLRYIPTFKVLGAKKIYLHAPVQLHRLIEAQGWDVSVLDKHNPELPEHDIHALTFDLPFLLMSKQYKNRPWPVERYLKAGVNEEVEGDLRIGICWEGGHSQANRSCPLKNFKILPKKATLYMLQPGIQRQDLIEECEDFELLGVEINDFLDTADLINSMDIVASIDTSVLHLAGALGKKTFGLLAREHDARWNQKWYPSIRLLKQKEEGDWTPVFNKLKDLGKRKVRNAPKTGIDTTAETMKRLRGKS